MEEDEHPYGELGDRLVTMLAVLQGATLDHCRDGPSGVYLEFQPAPSGHWVQILACGWMSLWKHGAEKGVLFCDGSNYLLREAVSKLPKGKEVRWCYVNPDNLAVHLHFANGDQVVIRPWPQDTDNFFNSTSMALWSGESYNSTLVEGLIIHHARLEPMSDVGSTYSKQSQAMTQAD